jgi:hypothetical protein
MKLQDWFKIYRYNIKSNMVAEMHYGGKLGNTRTGHSGMGGGGRGKKGKQTRGKKYRGGSLSSMMANRMAEARHLAGLQSKALAARKAGSANNALEAEIKRLTEVAKKVKADSAAAQKAATAAASAAAAAARQAQLSRFASMFRRGGGKRRTTRKSR